MVIKYCIGRNAIQVPPKSFSNNISNRRYVNMLQNTNISNNNRHRARKIQIFYILVFMKFRPPTPLKLQFLPNGDRICEYLNMYLFIRHETIVFSMKDQHQELDSSFLGSGFGALQYRSSQRTNTPLSYIVQYLATHIHAKAFVGSRGGGTILHKTFS